MRVGSRDSSRDGWIEESTKRKCSSGLFWEGGAAEKKTLNCHKYATFWGGFFNWAKKHQIKKKLSIRTKKLHSIKAKKILKFFRKYFILG